MALLLALVGGALIAAPFSLPSLWLLEFVGVALLFHAIRTAVTLRQAAWLGVAANASFMLAGFYWINYTIVVYGGIHPVFSALMFAGYAVIFGTKLPFLAALLFWVRGKQTWLTFPFVFMVGEMIQLSLFPWYVGSSQSFNHGLLQIADVIGATGISFIVALMAAVVESCWAERKLQPLPIGVAVAVMALTYFYGGVRMRQIDALQAAAPPLRVAAIQPNTPLRYGRRSAVSLKIIRTCADLTEKAALESSGRLDLVVWPEGGTPFSYLGGEKGPPQESYVDVELTRTVQALAAGLHTRLLFYDQLFEGDKPYNNVWLLNQDGRPVGSYQKIMLLAFGEYIPGADLIPALRGFGGVLDHRRGSTIHSLEDGNLVLAPQICYEIINPSFTRKFVASGADYIVNVTNDAWFGPTTASWCHLVDAIPRSVENRRPMVRCTNSGVSVMLDATGRPLTPFTPLFQQTWLTAELRSPDVESFYTRWGDVFSWTCAGIGLVLVGMRVLRRRG